MNKLVTLIKAEYRQEVNSRQFWLTTFLLPIVIIAIGVFVAYMGEESESFAAAQSHTPGPSKDITGLQVLGMMTGVFLTMFVVMYGAMIFNKVKAEKTGRIVEVLISCVPGRTVLFAKVIAVCLIGFTQILMWMAMLGVLAAFAFLFTPISMPWEKILDGRIPLALLLGLIFFIGGFAFYGSLFAMAGALTDRNNENQGYLSVIMLILMMSFYVSMFAVDNTGPIAQVCFYLPFTSASVATVQGIGGLQPWWTVLISALVLYVCAALTLVLSGKIYTSAILLKGKKLSPSDLIVFLKAK